MIKTKHFDGIGAMNEVFDLVIFEVLHKSIGTRALREGKCLSYSSAVSI